MSGQPGQITLLAQYRVVEVLILCVCLFVVGGDGEWSVWSYYSPCSVSRGEVLIFMCLFVCSWW